MKKRIMASVSAKLSLLLCLMVLLSSAAVGVFAYVLHRGDAIEDNSREVMSITKAIAAMIDGDKFEQALKSGEKDAHWYALKPVVDEIRRTEDLEYLYILDSSYSDTVRYYMEGYDSANGEEEEIDFNDREDIGFYPKAMFTAISKGAACQSDVYKSGDFGMMVSGYAPVFNSNGKVVGVIGADRIMEDVLAGSNRFALNIVLIIIVSVIIVAVVASVFIRRMIGRPVRALTDASQKLAAGDMSFTIPPASNDEIGELSQSFESIVSATEEQVAALRALADGDLTVHIAPRCQTDTMNISISEVIANLNEMMVEIAESARMITTASSALADGMHILEQNTSLQAGEINMLSGEMDQVSFKTRSNVEIAEKADVLSERIKQIAGQGSQQMQRMTGAVKDISSASDSIRQVIKVIDDIAFQTNILALNAAVEAAHAGQHGKGFAVVAEEVRSLAAKSAEAARNTGALIENSMQKARLGTEIASDTEKSLSEIVIGVNESGKIVGEIPKASGEQSNAIGTINTRIGKVAHLMQQNLASTESNAAGIQEMSAQAEILRSLVERFRLDERESKRTKYLSDSNR